MKRRVLLRGVFGVMGACALFSMAPAAQAQAQGEVGRTGGILTAKGDAWIEVKADGEKKAQRLLPRFIAALPPLPGGLDRVMLAKFGTLIVGNRVDVMYTVDQALRVVDIAMVPPEGRSGEVTGTVDEAGRGYIDVLPDEEEAPLERYYPRWIANGEGGGALDADMIKKLASLKAGDRVTVKWSFDERKRAVEVTKLAKEKAEAGTPEPKE